MTESAAREIIEFARAALPGAREASPLQKDLSRRTYYAVTDDRGRQVVLCAHADPADPAIGDFVKISSWLRAAGIEAPEVLLVEEDRGWVLQTFAGHGDVWSAEPPRRPALDEAVLEMLVRLQSLEAPEIVAARRFDEEKLSFEIDLFIDRYEQAQHALKLPSLTLELKLFFRRTVTLLASSGPEVFVHRDLHSRNVLVREESIVFIDFQDARMGLPWYDLASYLYDPYLDRGFAERHRLRKRYQTLAKCGESNLFYLQAFQRTLKAMGTYLGVLSSGPSPFYFDALRTAFGYLEEIAQLGGFPDHVYLLARQGFEILSSGDRRAQ